jgi:hypothetical protein
LRDLSVTCFTSLIYFRRHLARFCCSGAPAGTQSLIGKSPLRMYAAQRKPDMLGLACSRVLRNNDCWTGEGRARAMSKSDDAGFDFDRYRRLLAEADDEPKRLAFINLLVDEKAKDKLAGQALRGRLAELGLQAKK